MNLDKFMQHSSKFSAESSDDEEKESDDNEKRSNACNNSSDVVSVNEKELYTIEYEWKVQDNGIKSKAIAKKYNKVLEKSELPKDEHFIKTNRRKRAKKDILKTPGFGDPDFEICKETDPESSSDEDDYIAVGKVTKKIADKQERVYQCDMCDKTYTKSSHLVRHVRIHTGEKPFSCTVCGETFSLNSTLKTHRIIHSKEKRYPCDLCNLKFSRTGDMKAHRRVHTGEKPYTCVFCGKSFRQGGVLKKHERIHTGEKPYTCNICGRSFRQNGDAQKHIRTHTGEKPFECHICGKEFARNNDMQTHIRRHTGVKPYVCGVCSKSFVDNCALKRHMKIHLRHENKLILAASNNSNKTEILLDSDSMSLTNIGSELLSKPELFPDVNLSQSSQPETDSYFNLNASLNTSPVQD